MTISESYPIQKELLEIQTAGLQLVQRMQFGRSQLFEVEQWLLKVSSYCNRYLQDHPYYNNILSIIQSGENGTTIYIQYVERLLAFLSSVSDDKSYWATKPANAMNVIPVSQQYSQNSIAQSASYPNKNYAEHHEKAKIFIVHGHDDATRHEVARFVEKTGYDAVVLREQTDGWRTIMEKFEQTASRVSFAIILYTECDIGRAKDADESDEKYRARQNVVFEHGYFIGLLGREKVCALIKGNIELPSDLNSVSYTKVDSDGGWKLKLASIMKKAGFDVDMNKLME